MTLRDMKGTPMVLLLAVICCAVPARAGEEKAVTSAVDWVAALRYPGMTIDPDDSISVDLIVKNSGEKAVTVNLEVIEKPEGWKALVKGFGKIVSGVFVAGGEERTLTFSAEPEDKSLKELPSGAYRFAIKATSEATSLPQTTSLNVTVVEKEKSEDRITVSTSYPELTGSSDEDFEFTLDINNDSDDEGLFNFKANAPEGWEISFKPSYEKKQISSLKIPANQSKSVEVQVNPAYNAEAGEYPITVHVNSPKADETIPLKVILTGTYKIDTSTINNLLSLTTYIGKTGTVSLFVRNAGSAPQEKISFMSYKPENWEVKFEPDKIEGLPPGEVKQVEVTITPAEKALVGDYSVDLRVDGQKASDDVEMRVTVKAATLWGWIGVAIIVFVIVGLSVCFKLLGRR